MDEVFIRIRGVQHYLWRAVDQDGVLLDILVQTRRDADAAKRFFKRLLRTPAKPLSQNRAENSRQPTRRRERQMQWFKSPERAQNFLSAYAFIHGHFHPRRKLMAAIVNRAVRSTAFTIWQQQTCTQHLA